MLLIVLSILAILANFGEFLVVMAWPRREQAFFYSGLALREAPDYLLDYLLTSGWLLARGQLGGGAGPFPNPAACGNTKPPFGGVFS
jgi:hypothetical protein